MPDVTALTWQRTARRILSLWYFVLPIATVGLFTFVPFVHAAARLRRSSVWALVAVYGLIDAAAFAVFSTVRPESASPVSAVVLLTLLAALVTACVQLRPLRIEAYGLAGGPAPVVPTTVDPAADPAIAGVLAARARRAETRALAERDPLLARELMVGRPDLVRQYDDGGLVDLASAPAATLAAYCGLDEDTAARIVAARGSFGSVDELIVNVEPPYETWERLRDRGIVVR